MNFLTFLIFYSLFYSSIVLSADSSPSIEKIKKERVAKAQSFASRVSQVHSCKEALGSLSSQITDTKELLMRDDNFCTTIHREQQLQECFQFRSQSLAEMKHLKSAVSNVKTQCPFPILQTEMDEINENIKSPFRFLGYSLSYLEDVKKEVAHYKKTQAKIYNKYKLLDCHLKAPSTEISLWYLKAQRAYREGNLYMVHKALSALGVLNSYTTTLFSICDVENKEETELNQAALSGLKDILNHSQETWDKAKDQFGHMDFNKSAEKICQNLKDQNKDPFKLCENPLNNPSWAYSTHYFLMQETEGH